MTSAVPIIAPQLLKLLPSSIVNDKLMHDAAKALQPMLDDLQQEVEVPALYARIDAMTEAELRFLAWENRMLGAEWTLAQTLEDKRRLVKDSYRLNRLRGTRWAVERVFDLLRLRAVIKEWWEDTPNAAPGTFRVSVLDVAGRGILESEYQLIDELIEVYKPLTRHSTGVNMHLGVQTTGHVHIAASFVMRAEAGKRSSWGTLRFDGSWNFDGSQTYSGRKST